MAQAAPEERDPRSAGRRGWRGRGRTPFRPRRRRRGSSWPSRSGCSASSGRAAALAGRWPAPARGRPRAPGSRRGERTRSHRRGRAGGAVEVRDGLVGLAPPGLDGTAEDVEVNVGRGLDGPVTVREGCVVVPAKLGAVGAGEEEPHPSLARRVVVALASRRRGRSPQGWPRSLPSLASTPPPRCARRAPAGPSRGRARNRGGGRGPRWTLPGRPPLHLRKAEASARCGGSCQTVAGAQRRRQGRGRAPGARGGPRRCQPHP